MSEARALGCLATESVLTDCRIFSLDEWGTVLAEPGEFLQLLLPISSAFCLSPKHSVPKSSLIKLPDRGMCVFQTLTALPALERGLGLEQN